MPWNIETKSFDLEYASKTAPYTGAIKKWNFKFQSVISFRNMDKLLAYDYENGNKIPGIKLVRETYGVGLREAKDIYEDYEHVKKKQKENEIKAQEHIDTGNWMLAEFM